MKYDVVIIGGGPAGTSAAYWLAQAGARVAVLERTAYDTVRVGETLPPAIRIALVELGVWERFLTAGHAASPGIVSCWGSDEPAVNDFLFNPFGCGWHVNRADFDAMLAESAQAAGADVFLKTSVKQCDFGTNGKWTVGAESGQGPLSFQADYVLEATGRGRGFGGYALRRLRLDRLVGYVSFPLAGLGRNPLDWRTFIEAHPEGWWYSAPLPDGKLVLSFMTDADLVPRPQRQTAVWLRRCLAQSPLTRRRAEEYSVQNEIVSFAADTAWHPVCEKNRLAIGDAVMRFDPLSSQGILNALISGQRAAHAVLFAQTGRSEVFGEYIEDLKAEFCAYLHRKCGYYRREMRWPDSAFWKRRQHLSVLPPQTPHR